MSVFGPILKSTNFGDYVHPDKHHPQRDHNICQTRSNANTKAADAELWSRYTYWEIKAFGHNPWRVSNFPKPDLLYTMHIGMFNHLQKWIFHFLKMHERLNKYIAIWLPLPAYHDLTRITKSYEEVSEWTGKGLNGMSRYLHGVVTQALRGGSPAQSLILNRTIECTQAL